MSIPVTKVTTHKISEELVLIIDKHSSMNALFSYINIARGSPRTSQRYTYSSVHCPFSILLATDFLPDVM